MPRIKRGYQRTLPTGDLKKDYRLFAIATEGTVREVEYFNKFELMSSRIVVDIIEGEDGERKSAPQYVLERAINYVESHDLIDEDSIWLVMDIDRWTKEQLNQVHEYCKDKPGWNMILSNPCFEVWLHYHKLQNLDAIESRTSAEFKSSLDRLIPGGYHPYKYVPFAKEAAKNAEAADIAKGWYPDFKVTQVYKLIDEMMKFIGVNDFNDFIDNKLPELIKESKLPIKINDQ